MKEYTIVRTCCISDQIDEVNDHMKRGWLPVGNVFVIEGKLGDDFYQSMTRELPEKTGDNNQSIYAFANDGI